MLKKILTASALVCLPVLLCACADKLDVRITDQLLTVEISLPEGTSVEQALEAAGIVLGEKDRVEPSLETEVNENDAMITVMRNARVTVADGENIVETELTGGTVADALAAAGIENPQDAFTNIPYDCPLKDGMEIRVIRPEGEAADSGWVLKGVLDYKYLIDGKIAKNIRADGLELDADGTPAGNIVNRAWAYVQAVYNEVTEPGMEPEEKLKAGFDFIGDKANLPYQQKVPFYNEENWPLVYMNDMLSEGKSDCHALAAFFAYYAKLCGYEDVYLCSNGKHAWTQIDGLVYDPVFIDWNEYIFGLTYAEAGKKNYLATYINYTSDAGWRRLDVADKESEQEKYGSLNDDELLGPERKMAEEEPENGWVMTDCLAFQFRYYENDEMVSDREVEGVKIDKDGVPSGDPEPYTQAFVKALYNYITSPDMSREEKLERGYYFIGDKSNFPYKQLAPSHDQDDWPVFYMNDMLVNGESDCHALAAFFGLYAKLCGYEDVYLCCTGEVNTSHGWAEIDGMIYDPVVIDWPELVYGDTLESTSQRMLLPDYGFFGDNESWRRIKVEINNY